MALRAVAGGLVTNPGTTAGSPSNLMPTMDGVGTPGTSLLYARGDHQHPANLGVINTNTIAPASPVVGQPWFDPVSLQEYVWYNDGSSSQWVPTSPGATGLTDAPNDANTYGRHAATWVPVLPVLSAVVRSVLDFLPTGQPDGTTDNTNAINTAITACAGKAILYFPVTAQPYIVGAGTATSVGAGLGTTQGMLVISNTHLIIDGTIRLPNSAPPGQMIAIAPRASTTPTQNIIIEGKGTLDGNYANQDASGVTHVGMITTPNGAAGSGTVGTVTGAIVAGTDLPWVKNLLIQDISIVNFQSFPCTLSAVENGIVRNVHVTGAWNGTGAPPGMAGTCSWANGCLNCWFVNCRVSNIADVGPVIYGGGVSCGIVNCTISGCRSGPCVLADNGQPMQCSDNLIMGNTVYNTVGYGISISSNITPAIGVPTSAGAPTNTRIIGNNMYGNQGGGLFLGAAIGVLVEGNTSRGNIYTPGTGIAQGDFLVNAAATHRVTITGNSIFDTMIGNTDPTKGFAIWLNSGPSQWQANVAYKLNAQISDGTNIQQATTAGTSGATAPTWATTLNATTADGTVVWTMVGVSGNEPDKCVVNNNKIGNANGYTGTLAAGGLVFVPTGMGGAIGGSTGPQCVIENNTYSGAFLGNADQVTYQLASTQGISDDTSVVTQTQTLTSGLVTFGSATGRQYGNGIYTGPMTFAPNIVNARVPAAGLTISYNQNGQGESDLFTGMGAAWPPTGAPGAGGLRLFQVDNNGSIVADPSSSFGQIADITSHGVIRTYAAFAESGLVSNTATSGATVTIPDWTTPFVVQASSSLAALNLVMPATTNLVGGQLQTVLFSNAVGSLSLAAASGASIAGAPTFAAANSAYTFIYNSTSHQWMPRDSTGIGSVLLTNAANDAAAATAGVAVGQLYRNGSVVMQRVT